MNGLVAHLERTDVTKFFQHVLSQVGSIWFLGQERYMPVGDHLSSQSEQVVQSWTSIMGSALAVNLHGKQAL